jgi:glycosyltransferase involved in cell wall biosynthesis
VCDMNTLSPYITAEASPHGSAARPVPTLASAVPTVEVVIPVYNEQEVLAASVRTLRDYLSQHFTFAFEVTVADNASIDATLQIANALSSEFPEVEVLHVDRKGRGRALRAAWSRSVADVVAYMDVDLSTDLSALPPLLEPLLEGRADLAIGSRLAAGAEVTRGLKREVISRSYNILLRTLLGVGFSDAQCGFKAGRREAIQPLLAAIEDEAWFFDTELLYLAQRRKLSVHEVPVCWTDDPDSRVDILATAYEDLRGVKRLRKAERARAKRNPPPNFNRTRLRQGSQEPPGSGSIISHRLIASLSRRF